MQEQSKDHTDEKSVETIDKNKEKKRWWTWVIAAVIALLSFGGGIWTGRAFLDEEIRALLRLKDRVQTSYYKEITDEEFYDVLFNAVNDDLLDEYSKYMTADEYAKTKTEAKGEQSGIGLVFSTVAPDGKAQMRVVRVCGNSPAEEKGICAGDYVIGFGKTAESITKNNVFTDFSTFLSSYKTGEEFFLEFENKGIVSIAKEVYVENYVFYRDQNKGYGFTGNNADRLTEQGEGIPLLDSQTAYIRLTQFNGGAAEEFSQAMSLFKRENKKNLILDLRGNGGGYLDVMRDISAYFCKGATDRKPVVAIADYGDEKEIFRATDNLYAEYFQEGSRICVLADNSTASASECLIGCMLDYGTISYSDICLSTREGITKTYGKGIMQTTYPLSWIEGDAVKLTTAKICWPVTEHCIHGVGILPENGTKTVEENYQGDEELHAAIQALF